MCEAHNAALLTDERMPCGATGGCSQASGRPAARGDHPEALTMMIACCEAFLLIE